MKTNYKIKKFDTWTGGLIETVEFVSGSKFLYEVEEVIEYCTSRCGCTLYDKHHDGDCSWSTSEEYWNYGEKTTP
jgi:hypothetical protein